MILHCWHTTEEGTCMLPRGHFGPHERLRDEVLILAMSCPDPTLSWGERIRIGKEAAQAEKEAKRDE